MNEISLEAGRRGWRIAAGGLPALRGGARVPQGKVPGVLAVGGARAGRAGASSDARGGRGPQLPVGCDEFQSIPNTFWGNYVEAKSKCSTFGGAGGHCLQRAWVSRRGARGATRPTNAGFIRSSTAATTTNSDELLIFPMSSNQFQTLFGEIMRRRNQNAACLAGWTASVYSERGLAGAARAEVRAGLANAPYQRGFHPIVN